MRSCILPSEKVPVAVSCTLVRLAMEGFGGVIAIELRVAEVTLTVVDPETPSLVAVMVALPTPRPVTWPNGSTIANASFEEVQLTVFVRSSVVPSERFPVAVSCTLKPLAVEGSGGVITIELRIADVTVTVVDPETPALLAVMVAVPGRSADTKPPVAT